VGSFIRKVYTIMMWYARGIFTTGVIETKDPILFSEYIMLVCSAYICKGGGQMVNRLNVAEAYG
jgi:hypothetical protein